MTLFQKLLIGGTLALAAGAAINGIRQASTTRSELRLLNEEGMRLDATSASLIRAKLETAEELDRQQEENERLSRDHADLLKQRDEPAHPPALTQTPQNTDSDAHHWPARVTQLQQCLELNPAARIPEMKLLDEGDWLSVAKDFPLKTQNDYRRALSALRATAQHKFGEQAYQALQAFQRAQGGQVPANFAMLEPYFDTPPDPAILTRWTIAFPETLPAFALGSDFVATQMSAVDPEIDGATFVTSTGPGATSYEAIECDRVLGSVLNAYQKAHGDQNLPESLDLKTLLPFVGTPEQKAMLQKALRNYAARAAIHATSGGN